MMDQHMEDGKWKKKLVTHYSIARSDSDPKVLIEKAKKTSIMAESRWPFVGSLTTVLLTWVRIDLDMSSLSVTVQVQIRTNK